MRRADEVVGVSSHYDALSVSTDATPSEIRKAWRKVAFDCHPDRASVRDTSTAEEKALAERFKRAVVAWSILRDDAARAAYDREGARGHRRSATHQGRTVYAQAYGNPSWRRAAEASYAFLRRQQQEFLRQEARRARRNAQRKQAQAVRRAEAKQRAADRQTNWEVAHEEYLQGLVQSLRCELAAFLLDDP